MSTSALFEYSALLENYVRDLARARDEALRRQEGRFRTWTRRLGSEARAREKLAAERPPSADLKVVAVVRKYWLACEDLNRRAGRRVVEPEVFLVDDLRGRSPELAEFVQTLPYWPIGADDYRNAGETPRVEAASHTELFANYVDELSNTIRAIRNDRRGSSESAMRAHATALTSDGAERAEYRQLSTDPRVISVYRKYFLACDRLNREHLDRSFIPPVVFTTEMLMGSHDDLFDIIVELPYSPVGVDENDRYV